MRLAIPAEALLGAPPRLTREVFGNIPGWAVALFYVLSAIAVACWAFGIWGRAQRWRQGRPAASPTQWALAAKRLLRDVLLQRRFRGRPWASSAHRMLFAGFIVLLIGTTLIAIEHFLADLLGRAPDDPVFHKGVYFGVYEVVMDLFGLALLAGCAMLLARRLRGAGSFAKSPADIAILVLLLTIGVTGYVVEGLRIIFAQTYLPGLSPVGYLFARMFAAIGVDVASARALHFALWWFHAALALGFIALMPYTRLLHSIAGTLNLALRDNKFGPMQPVSLDEVEATGEIGVARLPQFSRRQLIELDACVSCGRCQDACPAFEVGKPLSPRNVVQDLVAVMNSDDACSRQLPVAVISADTLWSCTTCGACAEVCPLGISPLRMITDMRRFLIGEGALRGSPATALQKTDRVGNPWGLSQAERLAWADGLNVPLAKDNRDFEILYWVGCAASYDRRVQKIARSVVRLLQAAQVNFAVLGPDERCTGESARRMGDELLFQQLAEQNVETLARHDVRRIVAHCPHCVNSLRSDYPQVGGNYEVIHHSQLLAELLSDGRLPKPKADTNLAAGPITYHDPCYLARASGVTEPPRDILATAAATSQLPIVELPRNRRQTSCCGGGGGRMWFDDALAQRVGQSRAREIAASGAAMVAVSCPFCMIMLGDSMAAQDSHMRVSDIAEILADAILDPEIAISPASDASTTR